MDEAHSPAMFRRGRARQHFPILSSKGLPVLDRFQLLVSSSVLSLFLVLACTTTPSNSNVPASAGNQSETTARSEAKSEPEAEAAAEQSGLIGGERESSDCLDNGDLNSISREFAANPFRARETYVDDRICLTGRIEKQFREENSTGVYVRITDDWGIKLDKRYEWRLKTPRLDYHLEMEEWEGWMMASSVEDSVEFECTIASIPDSEQDYDYPPGTPKLRGCVPVSASGVAFMPTSVPMPTETPPPPEPTWTPKPTPTLPRPLWLRHIGCEDCPILKLERGFDVSVLSEGERYRATACTEFGENSVDTKLMWGHRGQHNSFDDVGLNLLDGSYAKEYPTGKKFGSCMAMQVSFEGIVWYYQDRTYGGRVSRRQAGGHEAHGIPTFIVVTYTRILEAQHERGYFPEDIPGRQDGNQ